MVCREQNMFNISEKFQVALSRYRKESFSPPLIKCIFQFFFALVFLGGFDWLKHYNEVEGFMISDEGSFEEGA